MISTQKNGKRLNYYRIVFAVILIIAYVVMTPHVQAQNFVANTNLDNVNDNNNVLAKIPIINNTYVGNSNLSLSIVQQKVRNPKHKKIQPYKTTSNRAKTAPKQQHQTAKPKRTVVSQQVQRKQPKPKVIVKQNNTQTNQPKVVSNEVQLQFTSVSANGPDSNPFPINDNKPVIVTQMNLEKNLQTGNTGNFFNSADVKPDKKVNQKERLSGLQSKKSLYVNYKIRKKELKKIYHVTHKKVQKIFAKTKKNNFNPTKCFVWN